MAEPVLFLKNVVRGFVQADQRLEVLAGVDLRVEPGEIVALNGPSGAGKSTLLHVAGLLEPPESGRVEIGGEDASRLDDARRTALRRERIGFVYQAHHLLADFTALENVAVPQMIAGTARGAAERRARDLLNLMGLADRANHRPGELSGGQQQRVAICRALANRPALLLADEPTGNLDPDTGAQVFDALIELARGQGLAALVATHDPGLAARMDRRIILQHGRLHEEN